MLNLKSFEEYINESVWGGILDRGSGETIRKEDDIDILDGEGFCEYLNKRYNTHIRQGIHYFERDISVPILSIKLPKKKIGTYHTIRFDTENKIVYIWHSFKNDLTNTYKQLNDNFKLEEDDEKIKIYSKDNKESTNSFFIDVIEFLLDNAIESKVLFRNN